MNGIPEYLIVVTFGKTGNRKIDWKVPSTICSQPSAHSLHLPANMVAIIRDYFATIAERSQVYIYMQEKPGHVYSDRHGPS